jgi:hypothetical protein
VDGSHFEVNAMDGGATNDATATLRICGARTAAQLQSKTSFIDHKKACVADLFQGATLAVNGGITWDSPAAEQIASSCTFVTPGDWWEGSDAEHDEKLGYDGQRIGVTCEFLAHKDLRQLPSSMPLPRVVRIGEADYQELQHEQTLLGVCMSGVAVHPESHKSADDCYYLRRWDRLNCQVRAVYLCTKAAFAIC